jgi:2,4-dienoyl-CoA reductase-like NADH-dependent reductase (Old Yellow Enzyme family)
VRETELAKLFKEYYNRNDEYGGSIENRGICVYEKNNTIIISVNTYSNVVYKLHNKEERC